MTNNPLPQDIHHSGYVDSEPLPLHQSGEDAVERLRRGLLDLAERAEDELCRHEDTYRGGAIWTICHGCGRKWADDEGGFKPYSTPDYIVQARSLATLPIVPVPASGEPTAPVCRHTQRPASECREHNLHCGAPACFVTVTPPASGEALPDDDEPKTWRELAEAAIADLRRYAEDDLPHRRIVSAESYEERAHLLATLSSPPSGEVGELVERLMVQAGHIARGSDGTAKQGETLYGEAAARLTSMSAENAQWRKRASDLLERAAYHDARAEAAEARVKELDGALRQARRVLGRPARGLVVLPSEAVAAVVVIDAALHPSEQERKAL